MTGVERPSSSVGNAEEVAGRGARRPSASFRPDVVPAAPSGEEGGGTDPATPQPLPRHASFRWCYPCNTRDRLHVHGVCQMSHTHEVRT